MELYICSAHGGTSEKGATMNRDEWEFKAVAESGRHRYEIKSKTFASAERSARQILKHNEVFSSARVEDRKGQTLRGVGR